METTLRCWATPRATRNPTAYSAATELSGLAPQQQHPAAENLGGTGLDLTGKVDFDTGAKISQGASLFANTALTKAGFPVVERLDNSVAEIELNYSRKHLLSDNPQLAGQSPDNYRRIYAGQIAGSSYYNIVGGVTELNYNIRSSASTPRSATVWRRACAQCDRTELRAERGIDLRLVNSRTQEVIDTVSYQKQLIGKSLNLGLNAAATRSAPACRAAAAAWSRSQAPFAPWSSAAFSKLTPASMARRSRAPACSPGAEPQGPAPADLAYQASANGQPSISIFKISRL